MDRERERERERYRSSFLAESDIDQKGTGSG